jgi:hypothetical protein
MIFGTQPLLGVHSEKDGEADLRPGTGRDNGLFRRWLTDTVFGMTYDSAS